MKKILFSIIGIIALGLVVWLLFGTGQPKTKSYYPDSEGWNRKALQGDEFQVFLPVTLQSGLYLISPDEAGVLQVESPTASKPAFVEYRDNTQTQTGIPIVKARRSFYGHEKIIDEPVFKIWVEQTSSENFAAYKNSILQELREYEPGGPAAADNVSVEKFDYQGHEYYTYLRNDLSYEGLKGKNSIGGAYMLFPEKNTVMYIFLFNTKYQSADTFLLAKENIIQTIEQFIDSAT